MKEAPTIELAAPDRSPPGLDPTRLKIKTLAVAIGVNLLGGLIYYFYIALIDSSSAVDLSLIDQRQAVRMALIPALICGLASWIYARPVFAYFSARPKGAAEPPDDGGAAQDRARGRSMRMPLVCSGSAMAGWLMMGILIGSWVWITGRSFIYHEPIVEPQLGQASDLLNEELFRSGWLFQTYWTYLAQALKGLGLAALLGGMTSASVLFVIESVWRRELKDAMPEGREGSRDQAWIIPVRYRLITIFVLVGTVPLVLLGILSYQRATTYYEVTGNAHVLPQLLVVIAIMVSIGVVLAIGLSFYVARSVSEPLESLRRAFERVGQGDLAARAPARSGDEFGRVAEGFNLMVRSLAEQDASIRELTQGLEDKVEQRTRELKQALRQKEEAQSQLIQTEKMAGLGLLVAGVAHEINNPLGFIYANADLLQRYLKKLDQEARAGDREAFDKTRAKMEQVLQSSAEGAKRAKEIVASLKRFSRKESSARSPTDVREALDAALMLLSHELKAGIEVHKNYREVPAVAANSGELSQVFINVIQNSIQAMAGAGKIALEISSRDGKVLVSIVDDGPGVAAADLAHVFDPFFTTKEVGVGTGLGLSIAYGIVKAHGGEIELSSRPGQGTEARVTLPAMM